MATDFGGLAEAKAEADGGSAVLSAAVLTKAEALA
jgi:hypothetical protein